MDRLKRARGLVKMARKRKNYSSETEASSVKKKSVEGKSKSKIAGFAPSSSVMGPIGKDVEVQEITIIIEPESDSEVIARNEQNIVPEKDDDTLNKKMEQKKSLGGKVCYKIISVEEIIVPKLDKEQNNEEVKKIEDYIVEPDLKKKNGQDVLEVEANNENNTEDISTGLEKIEPEKILQEKNLKQYKNKNDDGWIVIEGQKGKNSNIENLTTESKNIEPINILEKKNDENDLKEQDKSEVLEDEANNENKTEDISTGLEKIEPEKILQEKNLEQYKNKNDDGWIVKEGQKGKNSYNKNLTTESKNIEPINILEKKNDENDLKEQDKSEVLEDEANNENNIEDLSTGSEKIGPKNIIQKKVLGQDQTDDDDRAEVLENQNNEDSNNEDFSAGSDDEWTPTNSRQNRNQTEDTTDCEDEDAILPENGVKKKKGVGPFQRKLRLERAIKRKNGEEYTTAKGKIVPARHFELLPTTCREKCHEIATCLNGTKIYEDYRNLPNRETQKRYIASLIQIRPKDRIRNTTNVKNRQITVKYTLEGIDGNICKNCFLKVFGETRGFLDETVKKKRKSESFIIIQADERGNSLPGNKTSAEDIHFIKDFINSFPAYESHYSRRHTTKRYLSYDLNLTTLYKLYKEKFLENNSGTLKKPVSMTVFREVFMSLNIRFKKPSNDTCKTCDAFVLKLKSCSEEQKQQIENEKNEHQRKADFHYKSKKDEKELARKSSGKVVVATFDLQKCLATPHLSASVSFYKRKLWTFNLTVRNTTSNKTSCYIWHEGVAQRGADEIASCLYKFILDLPDEVETLILYSDTCPGQNRNNILPVMFCIALAQKSTLKEIHHKFLVPGHTHLECDSDHALIERFVKKHNPNIAVPQDWVNVIKMTSKNFSVKFMTQTEFYGFSKLLTKNFVKKNIDTSKQSFAWNSIFWLKFEEKSAEVSFKYSLEKSEPFRTFSMNRRGRQSILETLRPEQAYVGGLAIENKKFKDLMDLMQFIDPVYRDFYTNLNQSASVLETYSDSEEDYDLYPNE